MKMTYSLAVKYGKIFELMGKPQTLMILDYLFETRTAKTIEDLVSISKSTKSVVSPICEELYDLSIVDRDYEGSTPTYKALDTRYANFVEKIIEYID